MSPRKSTADIDRLPGFAGATRDKAAEVKHRADDGAVQAAYTATDAVDRVRTKARDLVQRAEANAPAGRKSKAVPALGLAGVLAGVVLWRRLRRR
ncbi:hypothetical protein [Nocardia goodfellowii]|uniref:ElaB/YqjD/DUF883 family membrane-anchored ribosome-binding protein n=1 Tax=Nocardia goodfellowii TaxID=882446 RepID=A0ABS4QQD3_9NOCA|nr:hypothetical protein [Nocardia goodfellowii]MBP2193892.1 ElaB/YqjD/DUF883 family membrane-anchored ribosome-binding protein [Nocardia goodfellowii]